MEFYDVTTIKNQINCRRLHGRRVIYTSELEITDENVLDVLSEALPYHAANRSEIEYLFNYRRGYQPIIDREKKIRDEICNRIIINLADSTVAFKAANFIGYPLQYVSRGADEQVPIEIEKLNSFMLSENKASKDLTLADDFYTCGLGYRLVLRDKAEAFMKEELFDEAPFEIYTLDPRTTFVIRSRDVTRKVLAGVTCTLMPDNVVRYTVYTPNKTYYIRGEVLDYNRTANIYPLKATEVEQVITHNFGMVPIVEYQCNTLRMGAFEVALDILDAINNIQSNRLDGVEQFIQAIMVFENADITDEQFKMLKEQGALKISSKDGNVAKVYYLNEQLDQSQTQTLIDDLKLLYYEIVGMPSQGDGSTADSSNNGAVYMKNGLYSTNARTMGTDGQFRLAETDFLRIVLNICKKTNALNLKLSDIDMKPGIRAYEDLLTKTQSYSTLMSSGCSPRQAAQISGLVADPESFAIEFENYGEQKAQKAQERAAQLTQQEVENSDAEETVVVNDGEKPA